MNRPVCPDCKQTMVKMAHQNEEGDWIVSWGCECSIPKDYPIDKFGELGIELTVHSARVCELTRDLLGEELDEEDYLTSFG